MSDEQLERRTRQMRFRGLPIKKPVEGRVIPPSPWQRWEGPPGQRVQTRNWSMVEYGQGLSAFVIAARRQGLIWPTRPDPNSTDAYWEKAAVGGGQPILFDVAPAAEGVAGEAPVWNAGINVAVVQFTAEDGSTKYLVRPSGGPNGHSEPSCLATLDQWGIPLDRITALYTERMPCCNDYTNCAAMMDRLIPNVPVTFSVEFDQENERQPQRTVAERLDPSNNLNLTEAQEREASGTRGGEALRSAIRTEARADRFPHEPLTDEHDSPAADVSQRMETGLDLDKKAAQMQERSQHDPVALRILAAVTNDGGPGTETLEQVKASLDAQDERAFENALARLKNRAKHLQD